MSVFRSQPIPMIQENKQISAVKFSFGFQYSNSGEHLVGGGTVKEATVIKVYGINQDGASGTVPRNLIATIPLATTSAYTANDVAQSVVIGVPVDDYPFICWEYNPATQAKFVKLVGQPIMFSEVKEFSDVVDAKLVANATSSTGN